MVFMVNEKMYNSSINLLDKKAYEEAAKRLKLKNEREKEMVIPRLRIKSLRNISKKEKMTRLLNLKKIS